MGGSRTRISTNHTPQAFGRLRNTFARPGFIGQKKVTLVGGMALPWSKGGYNLRNPFRMEPVWPMYFPGMRKNPRRVLRCPEGPRLGSRGYQGDNRPCSINKAYRQLFSREAVLEGLLGPPQPPDQLNPRF